MLHIEIGYSHITSYMSTTKVAVPERIELSRSARQADIMATRSWDQLVQAVGIEPTGSVERRFYGPVPYHYGGACKIAEETGVEPACARTSDTDWFSGPAPHRGAPLPNWRRVSLWTVAWCGWGDSNSQSAGSKPAAFAILATPARLNFSKSSPGSRGNAAQLGKTKPAHFERVGVITNHPLG